MNNDIISKNCWRGKGLRALSGFDNTPLPHLSRSLWTNLAAAAWFSVKPLWRMVKRSLWFDVVFSVLLLTKTLQEGRRERRKMRSLQLSFPFCVPVLFHPLSLFFTFYPSFFSSFFPFMFLHLILHPLSLISFIISFFPALTFLLLVPLSGRPSSSLSILFYH